MKTSHIFLASFLGLILTGAPIAAHATGWVDHFMRTDTDFRPYLENGTDPHNAQWRRESWRVADWAPDTGAGMDQIEKFFNASILTDYHHATWISSPRLVVGPMFYRLSGYDQRRVLETFDDVYHVTAHKSGTLFLEDETTRKTIGLYTKSGVQFQ